MAQPTDRKTLKETYPLKNKVEVEEGLYLGGMVARPPPGTRAVLNVCETKDPYEVEVHRWQPIVDGEPAPTIDWLRQQVEFVHAQRRAGLPLYVHCRAGFSRSGMVVTAYLMWRDGSTRDEALTAIRGKRSLVNPNPAFMQLLSQWGECINK
jgi:protein-tyrosine phosphatase